MGVEISNIELLNKIINGTVDGDIDWLFIGKTTDKFMFIYPYNLVGKKFIITELDIFKNKMKNKLIVYMQNITSDDKFIIKKVGFNSRLYELTKIVIDITTPESSWKNDFDEIRSIYGI